MGCQHQNICRVWHTRLEEGMKPKILQWCELCGAIREVEGTLIGIWVKPDRPATQASVLGTPMLLWCPECGRRHLDEGEWSTKLHHTHACQHCGHCWRPAVVNTCGVRFLPGFKNTSEAMS